ncbi:MAG TPA: LysE family translocator [Myxococcaceae bacterium]|nr:LysE family translocator [Myxococcaceae bacterium]
MTLDTLLALASFAFVSSITPGPNNLMLMASGTNFGFMRTVPHLMGVALGFVLMLVLVGAGVATVFEAVPGAANALKVASVLYLLYLAWKVATAQPPSGNPTSARPLTFLQAAAFQWVNPKAWTMALTAAAVYVPEEGSGFALLVVALVFGAVNLPSVTIWALVGVRMRRLLDRPRTLRAFNVGAALLLIASLYPVLSADLSALPQ